ncbi:MAG: peptide deformylase [Bdellovibrionales bacterium]|nr:peptide deformylase [Bdellovibrionales bacterium]
MAKLKIYTFPDVVLAQAAEPVQRVEKSMHGLADDMLETMYDAPGIGLAANQVGILQRILVMDTEFEEEEDEEGMGIIRNKKPVIIINPEIILLEGKTAIEEGCLSVPEYTSEVPRAEKVKLRYQDIDGLERTLMAEGLQAVCIQHEMDHLDGKLFIDRLGPMKKEMAKKRLLRERAIREAAGLSPKKGHKGF